MTKGFLCQYPDSAPKATGPGAPQNNIVPGEPGGTTPSSVADTPGVDKASEASNGDMVFYGNLDLPDPDFANAGDEYALWDNADVGLVDFLNTQANDPDVLPTPSSSFFGHSIPSIDDTIRLQQQAFSPSNLSIPASPSSTVRSLNRRPRMHAGAQRTTSLILHTLKSYVVMLRQDTLPPFLHPSLVSSNVENPDMEPMTNCISLIHMMGNKTQGSRKLFWRNVRQECERLCEDVCPTPHGFIRERQPANRSHLAKQFKQPGTACMDAGPLSIYPHTAG